MSDLITISYDEPIIIETDGVSYRITEDPLFNDWRIVVEDEYGGNHFYVKTRHGAFQYVLEDIGAIEGGDYDLTTDRV